MSKHTHPALEALREAGDYIGDNNDAHRLASAVRHAIPALEALLEERDRFLDSATDLRMERDELRAALESFVDGIGRLPGGDMDRYGLTQDWEQARAALAKGES